MEKWMVHRAKHGGRLGRRRASARMCWSAREANLGFLSWCNRWRSSALGGGSAWHRGRECEQSRVRKSREGRADGRSSRSTHTRRNQGADKTSVWGFEAGMLREGTITGGTYRRTALPARRACVRHHRPVTTPSSLDSRCPSSASITIGSLFFSSACSTSRDKIIALLHAP
ncbi:hypothetical protein HETIRDRAFT_442172 [Heterobasidion irregulare TC 32-1]|uniref:Uncharacterized protein n=1 Tax=Heterobasidion irregulare (strain TC 32-1) TaxID=747525 RepID=W4JTT0_HETIT|nr:uncharacterized protein HETIRDRAFT_442172 [Heterobasidion irregulare TC 32-1]ETW76953.1 hypothetical protein HETIRDRAFT_442172 [Heterobasidion irregulare TC 32-1]